MTHLTVRLLGPFDVTLGGMVTAFSTQKARALLAYLAVEAERPHSREALAGLLWPDYPEASARKSLRTALADVRGAIGDREADPPYLHISRQTVQFNAEADAWCDVATFLELVAPPSDSPPWRESNQQLEEAVELYRGSFLEGFSLADSVAFDDWALIRREQLKRCVMEALQQLAAYHKGRGDYERGLRFAWRHVELDPWQERGQRQLMRLLALNGQRGVALAQYEVLRRTLADELGVEPAEATRALYEQVRGKAVRDSESRMRLLKTELRLPPAEATTAVDEQIRIGPEERAVTLAVVGRPAAASQPPHNLPAQATPFIGRASELNEIAQRLADPACRLLTLVGPGGSGKTRLALAAAEGVVGANLIPSPRPTFTDGVYFVPLQPVASVDHIVPTIASAIGFEFHGSSDPFTQLLNHLREMRLLLVLDNIEHLLTPSAQRAPPHAYLPEDRKETGTELVSALLSGAPELKILATSREALNLREEWLHQVEGLSFPQDDDTGPIDAYEAVRLFLECARRVRLGFSLDDERACVIRVCRLVEGMPLGIELAATWFKRLPCAEIVAEIQRGLDILETDLRGVPDRHRSMRAVFAHSWALLSPKERDVLRRLSVFRGGFRREASEAVADASLRTLSALVDKSMLRVTGDGRYEMHELQRQYAEERLGETPGLAAAVRDRHCAYFCHFMHQPHTSIYTGGKDAIRAIDADIDNVRAAWDWAVEHARINDLQKSMRNLYRFAFMRAWHREGERAFQAAVDALRAAEPSRARDIALAYALGRLGLIDLWMGRRQLAVERTQESLEIVRPLEARHELAGILVARGWVASAEGDTERARALVLEAIPLLEETGQIDTQGFAYQLLGGLAKKLGDYPESDRWYQKALTLAREIDDHRTIAGSLLNMGGRALNLGEYARARQLALEGLAVARAQEFTPFAIHALHQLGWIAENTGELETAERYFQESLATAREWGKGPDIAWSLIDLARAAAAKGDVALATAQCREALDLVRGTGNKKLEADVLAGLGDIAQRSGNDAEARRLLEESLALYPESGDPKNIAYTHDALGRLAMAQGAANRSRGHFHAALKAGIAARARPVMLASIAGVAELLSQEGDHTSARPLALLVMDHPASRAEAKDRATRLLAGLEATLPSDDLTAAREGDTQSDLDAVAAMLVTQLAAAVEANGTDRSRSDSLTHF